MPGAPSRWNAKKDMTWEPLRIGLVAEVAYEHMQRDRFRHTARFQRWRPDREPSSCTYEQLEVPVPMELEAGLRQLTRPLFGVTSPRISWVADAKTVVARSMSSASVPTALLSASDSQEAVMPKLRVHASLHVRSTGTSPDPTRASTTRSACAATELHSVGVRRRRRGGARPRRSSEAWDVGVGATIMGRNMFGPIRGAWGSEDWKGWWGDEPPYHHPVFVLTHHVQPAIPMAGGTTFHFVDGGIEDALGTGVRRRRGQGRRARRRRVDGPAVSRGPDWSTSCTSSSSPVMLGSGERLFEDLTALPAVRGRRVRR